MRANHGGLGEFHHGADDAVNVCSDEVEMDEAVPGISLNTSREVRSGCS